MHNPLRSEADAFRMVVVIGTGAAAVIALALLTEPVYGAILLGVLVGVGIGYVWQQSRGSLGPQKAEVAAHHGYRVLVLANETVGGRRLLAEIRTRCEGKQAEVLVVTPSLTQSGLQTLTSDVDEARQEARKRLEDSVQTIEAAGMRARGEVGDEDPNVALTDALATFGADEIVISTHPPERSRWLERGVVEKAAEEVDIPVTHVVVDLEAEAEESAA